MIDFATLQDLTIPEGVVTQIAKDGVVLWQKIMATDEPPVILEVAKQTLSTYDGGTTYNDEEFILLNIYPKKGGTVKVTYGGLTKTVTDTSGVEEPNAISVYFGTFNGVSDSIATPASGRLTIEGAYRGFGAGSWTNAKSQSTYCRCITGCIDIGNPVYIGAYTFYECNSLTLTSLPSGITTLENYTFYGCTNITLTSLPSGITTIGNYVFYGCTNITNITIPALVNHLGLRCLQCHVTDSNYGKHDTNIKMLGTVPTTMEEESSLYADSGAFGRNNFYDGKITVPKGYGEVYKTADIWSHYAEKIVEAS